MKKIPKQRSRKTPTITTLKISSHSARAPHFEIDNRGVWWVNVRTDKDGDIIEAEPLLLSDPIDIIGTGQDNDGAYYRIIKFKDKITRRHRPPPRHKQKLPMGNAGAFGVLRLIH